MCMELLYLPWISSNISSKLLHFVKSYPKPQNVPPPTFVLHVNKNVTFYSLYTPSILNDVKEQRKGYEVAL